MKISEYVSVGHPDKVADYISEYILDRLLEQDPNTRYALEVQIKDNFVTLGGEITTKAEFKEPLCWLDWVHEALAEIGYTEEYCEKWGSENTIDPQRLCVKAHISTQSPDIAQGVDNDGWGDQGIFWGMATRNPDTYDLPRDYYWAMKLCQHLYQRAKDGNPWGLDIKTQIVLDDNDKITKVIVAAPVLDKEYEEAIAFEVQSVLPDSGYALIINGTGAYIKHASIGDCGTTGRKLAVDFYGGNCRIGGGSPWTKDPTKADLTLNLLARELAKIALTERKLDTAYVSIGCCIGRPEIDITIYDGHNNVVDSYTYTQHVSKTIELLGLNKPIYTRLCMYGLWGVRDAN